MHVYIKLVFFFISKDNSEVCWCYNLFTNRKSFLILQPIIYQYIYIYIYIYIESLMSCHLLLNLLHELANMILCEALPSIISFLPTNVINLVINDNEFEILFIT